MSFPSTNELSPSILSRSLRWLAQHLNGTDNTELPEAACRYANDTYNISSTFRQIQNETFGVQYGTSITTGIVGYEDVRLGGITINGRQVKIVTNSVNTGDGINSGIIGFGHSILASAQRLGNISNATPI